MALLETQGLTVAYGGVRANDDVNVVVQPGQVCGLIGPNGAGKTTLIDAISGFTKPSPGGRILFDGRDITTHSPAQRADAGLARTFQSLELFDDLTVWENLLVAAERRVWWSFLVDLVRPGRPSGAEEQASWALDVMALHDLKDRQTHHLSHGQRKLVGVARAIAHQPQLVLLDEPAAGLDTTESEIIGQHVRDFLKQGITVLLIDHDMSLVLNVCDYIYVLDFGAVIAQGTRAEIERDAAVIAAYLGETVQHSAASQPT